MRRSFAVPRHELQTGTHNIVKPQNQYKFSASILIQCEVIKHITEIKAEHLVKDYVKSAIVDAGKQLNTRAVTRFLRAFWGFSPITKLLGRTECERNRDRRYEQLEISRETIKQEFRRVVCKHRQTDRHI